MARRLTIGRAPMRCSALAVSALSAISAAVAPHARAQVAAVDTGSAARLPFTVTPTFSASEIFTRSDAASAGNPRWEAITQLSPGVQLKSGTGRVRGFFNYGLNSYSYARDSSQNNLQQALSAALNAEAIPNFAFLDATANISQQLISPFGQQFSTGSAGGSLATGNRTEVRSYAVTPYVRGGIGGVVDYEARLSRSSSQSGASTLAGSTSDSASLQLNGSTAFSSLRWAATASRQLLAFDGGRKNSADVANLTLSYLLSPQFTLSASGGRESNDYISTDKRSSTTYGVGGIWRPSELTSLSANTDHRVYGNTYALNFSHRTARTVWTYSDSRSVSTGVGQPATLSVGTNYDLAYQLFNDADPTLRAQKADAYLRQQGIDPKGQIYLSFLTSALTLVRQQVLSAGLQGVRDSVTLSFTRSRSNHLDTLTAVPDALAGSSLVNQQGLSLNIGHRLTPTSSLNLNLSQQRVSGFDGLAGTARATRYSAVDLGWSEQIGRYTRAFVNARRGTFASTTSPYTETSLTAGVSLQF